MFTLVLDVGVTHLAALAELKSLAVKGNYLMISHSKHLSLFVY